MKWRGRRGRRRVRDEVEGPSWCAARRFTSLRHPDGRLGGRVREDVEHPNLPRVAHHQHLAGAAIGAVEAVLLREASHQRHRLASRADPLRCDVGQLVDREERSAAGQADRVGTENCRRGRFAKAEVTVVLGRIFCLRKQCSAADLALALCLRITHPYYPSLSGACTWEYYGPHITYPRIK